MNIRWNNIVAAVIGMAALIFAISHKASCRAALDSIEQVGPNNASEDRFVGFMVLGLIGICLVAIVRILTHDQTGDHRRRRDEPPEDRLEDDYE